MRPLDLVLLSFAIGLTLFTAWVFCTETSTLEAVEAPEPRNPAFRSIVLHHSATHGGSVRAFERDHGPRLGGLAYHFIVGNGSGTPDGVVETGYRWRDQIPGPHTKNEALNRQSIGICLVGNLDETAPTRRQMLALIPLLERLCRECDIPAAHIISHREADRATACPGERLPMAALRKLMARRLTGGPRPSTARRTSATSR